MAYIKNMALASFLTLATISSASAACDFKNDVAIKSISAGFEAWKDVTGTMSDCGNFSASLDQDFADKLPQALAANPALYQIAGVASDSVVAVLDAKSIRPLDDLVAKYGKDLSPNQLIKLNGKIYVIAMMVNTQNLLYRSDIFDQLNIKVPTTYDEVLAAADKIRSAGAMKYPIGATMKTGWNLAEEFVNMYLGYGGTFYAADGKPTVNNEAGVKALEMLKKLTAYMDPDYLTADSTIVQQQMQQGKIAISNLWASRAGAMDDPKESTVVGKVKSATAPYVVPGTHPATSLWWDGAAIAKNTTDEQAEAAFKLIIAGMSPATVSAHNEDAVWLIKGYTPGRLADGAIKSLQAGAQPYPVSTQMGLMHTALGNNLADFFTGKVSAQQALANAETAYTTAAKEAGVLN